jgi:hypothetical protein
MDCHFGRKGTPICSYQGAAGLIVGPNESVPIDQVMYLEKREFENVKVPISFSFDWEVSIAALIAIAAYAAEQR